MKYFICALDRTNSGSTGLLGTSGCLGIPAERTERIIPVSRRQTAVYETENDEVYISLPALFGLKDTAAPHGLVLKQAGEAEKKTVLLAPKVDIDLEIPEESIHRLPDALAGVFRYFRGAFFSGDSVIYILDTESCRTGIQAPGAVT